jgi:hypothetical protein
VILGEGADAIARASAAATAWLADARPDDLLALIGRIDIAPGSMRLQLDASKLAERLFIEIDAIDTSQLTSCHPFQLRKRGVETRIILADAPTGQDETLIRNIARAHAWFEKIKAGSTFAQIADAEGTSRRRVQQMIGLAFLAPEIVQAVLDGKQPTGFTSDWCKTHDMPPDWSDQRALLATLLSPVPTPRTMEMPIADFGQFRPRLRGHSRSATKRKPDNPRKRRHNLRRTGDRLEFGK